MGRRTCCNHQFNHFWIGSLFVGTNGNGADRINGACFGDLLYQTQKKTLDSYPGACLYGYDIDGTDVFGPVIHME